MEYLVKHRTTYRYLQDVSYSCHLAHLIPRDTGAQHVRNAELTFSPQPTRRHRRRDYFGNSAEWFAFDEPHALLEVLSQSRITVTTPTPINPGQTEPWEQVRAKLESAASAEWRDAVQYCFDSPLTIFKSAIPAYAAESFPKGRPVLAGAIDLMARIHRDFQYDTTVTDATTTVDRVFEIRAGVCQDLAHMGIACLRSLGLAARYVSGYLLTQPPPGRPRLVGADASHAWFSIWAPPFGWVDLDPTNNVLPGESHITVGWGRDYGDVAPINGVVTGGADHAIEVSVDVMPFAPIPD
ncbi:MAG TPA: transglutaminase family protein [Rhizomicrobium sp.]|jgi:transglutaminase-like putative cysteine protease